MCYKITFQHTITRLKFRRLFHFSFNVQKPYVIPTPPYTRRLPYKTISLQLTESTYACRHSPWSLSNSNSSYSPTPLPGNKKPELFRILQMKIKVSLQVHTVCQTPLRQDKKTRKMNGLKSSLLSWLSQEFHTSDQTTAEPKQLHLDF